MPEQCQKQYEHEHRINTLETRVNIHSERLDTLDKISARRDAMIESLNAAIASLNETVRELNETVLKMRLKPLNTGERVIIALVIAVVTAGAMRLIGW